MKILGIDNVFFHVLDLKKAAIFFEKLGFVRKLDIPQIHAILFSIGQEEPGLIVYEKQGPLTPSKLWVEVENAEIVKAKCDMMGIPGNMIRTGTGQTFEIIDDSGNIIGFADYSKKLELSRPTKDHTLRTKEIAEKYTEGIWNNRQIDLIDLLLDKEVAIHSLFGVFYGQQAMRDIVSAWLKGFPD